jgi:hypothetical protein
MWTPDGQRERSVRVALARAAWVFRSIVARVNTPPAGSSVPLSITGVGPRK